MTVTQAVAFTSTQIAAMNTAQVDTLVSSTPIVLDLDGNGIRPSTANVST